MRTNCQDVYAVGDIALFPIHNDQEQESSLVNIGHWQMALHHGRTAGKKLLNIFPPSVLKLIIFQQLSVYLDVQNLFMRPPFLSSGRLCLGRVCVIVDSPHSLTMS